MCVEDDYRYVCTRCGHCAGGPPWCGCWDTQECTACGNDLRKRQIRYDENSEWVDEPIETGAQEGDDPAVLPGDA